jgi:hypothetical protein
VAETYHVDISSHVDSTVDPVSLANLLSERFDNMLRSLYTDVHRGAVRGFSTDHTQFTRPSFAAMRDTFADHGLSPRRFGQEWSAGYEGDRGRVRFDFDYWWMKAEKHDIDVSYMVGTKIEADRLQVEAMRVLEGVSQLKRWKGAKFSLGEPRLMRTIDEGAPNKPLPGPLPTIVRRSLPKYLSDITKRYADQLVIGLIITVVGGLLVVAGGVFIERALREPDSEQPTPAPESMLWTPSANPGGLVA